MPEFVDNYDTYYADRLWQLIPGVYRARDSDDPAVRGPLQELVNRVGAQVAVVRRSIDRLWADQSIETSDDWVIPYIGDLLDTNLVNGLDARGQRLDVAKTIHYRRRKGTVAVLEEIARDVTGWDAHIVEGFRRLSRTRHNLDPAVGALNAALPRRASARPRRQRAGSARSPAPRGPDRRADRHAGWRLRRPALRARREPGRTRRSTSTSTRPTCGAGRTQSAATGSRSCSSSSGGSRASPSRAARR